MKQEHDDNISWIDVNLDVYDREEAIKPVRKPLPPEKKRVAKEILSYVAIVMAAVFAWLFISNLVLFNARIPSSSMEPTLNVEDRLLGFRLAYLFGKPKRGDIVIFQHQCYDNEDEILLIKRIVGMPGETIEVINGNLYIDGKLYEESYIKEAMLKDCGPFTIPDKEYFVMGDNRNLSDDSRLWTYKFVGEKEIIAKAWLKYSPEFEILR